MMTGNGYCTYVPGESVYGLVTSYHISSANLSWRETNREIFGRTHVRLHPVIPCHLSEIANYFGLSSKLLLNSATGFPLYAMSLGEESAQLGECLSSSKGVAVTLKSKQAAYALPLVKQFQYCPLCVAELHEQYGKLIWLSRHQLYGVTICHTHHCSLRFLPAGEGGINRQYVLPQGGAVIHTKCDDKAMMLSAYICHLFNYLQYQQSQGPLSQYYESWLNAKDYLTPGGRVRMKRLTTDLFAFWRPVFEMLEPPIPLELSNFSYVANIIYSRHPVHYLKHVLLMAFLCRSPESFFSIPLHDFTHAVSKPVAPATKDESHLIRELKSKRSLRSISRQHRVSVGYLKQVALRHEIVIERRRQKITEIMERAIWCKAFIGMHRQEIADQFGISVGAVEQIIQSHRGLSEWRRHLLMARRTLYHRRSLLNLMAANPRATRNSLKQSTSSYLWLYKHDRDWLYDNLPSAQTDKHYPCLDWAARDRILAIKIASITRPAASLSAIDRQLGGHAWLTHHAEKLPITLQAAARIVEAHRKAKGSG